MSTTEHASVDTLCQTARDISRHLMAMCDELAALRHPHAPAKPSRDAIAKQICKIQDQVTLLHSVVEDIARHEPDAA